MAADATKTASADSGAGSRPPMPLLANRAIDRAEKKADAYRRLHILVLASTDSSVLNLRPEIRPKTKPSDTDTVRPPHMEPVMTRVLGMFSR